MKKLRQTIEKQMNRFSHKSLFAKFFSVYIATLAICLFILGCTLTVFMGNYWSSQRAVLLRENARLGAEHMEALLSSNLMQENPEGAVLLMCNEIRIVSQATGADVFVCSPDGKVILCKELMSSSYEVDASGRCLYHGGFQISEAVMQAASKEDYYSKSNLDGVYKEKQFIAAEPVRSEGRVQAVVFAVEPYNTTVKDFVLDILKMFIFAAFVSLCLGFFAIYATSYRLVRPLREMSAATKRYAAGDFSPRVKVRGSDELAELTAAFNAMASALSVLEGTRRSFVANVSHELKTPMTTIGGFIDGILDGTIPPEQEKHYLGIVSDETKRLSRLVTAMLNMSKMEAGELKLNPKRFDISASIFNILLSFEREIEKKHIEILGLAELKSVYVNADEDMMYQVIYNLVENAVKFTENGSIYVSVLQGGKNTYIKIRNTGAGISSEELSRIFERFYKVDKSRSYDVKGAGLGLYLVKTIMEMHGGGVAVTSTEGEFTEFTVTLPDIKIS